MEESASASATVGATSSSSMVSVTADGAATPLFPLTTAETVTSLSGASAVLSTAVTVTVPVLLVSPATMVKVFADDRLKSPDVALVPAAAPTVSVTASLDARFNVAVTVADPGVGPVVLVDRRVAQRQRRRRRSFVVGQRQRRPGHRAHVVTVLRRPGDRR